MASLVCQASTLFHPQYPLRQRPGAFPARHAGRAAAGAAQRPCNNLSDERHALPPPLSTLRASEASRPTAPGAGLSTTPQPLVAAPDVQAPPRADAVRLCAWGRLVKTEKGGRRCPLGDRHPTCRATTTASAAPQPSAAWWGGRRVVETEAAVGLRRRRAAPWGPRPGWCGREGRIHWWWRRAPPRGWGTVSCKGQNDTVDLAVVRFGGRPRLLPLTPRHGSEQCGGGEVGVGESAGW